MTLPEPEHWRLHKVVEAMTVAKAPEERQLKEFWAALREADLPRKMHSVVRCILCTKLPLAERMPRMSMADGWGWGLDVALPIMQTP